MGRPRAARPSQHAREYRAVRGAGARRECDGQAQRDDGARRALRERGKSLLPPGVARYEGDAPHAGPRELYRHNARKLNLFFAEEGNWGSIFAIRTGSADYSHKVLANGWVRQGFKSEGGYLFRDGEKYEVREEEDLFRLIGVSYVEPEKRNLKI